MTTTSGLTGVASTDLGLGNLSQQQAGETEEEKKRRLALMQQQRSLGPAAMSLGLGYGG